MKVGRYWMDLMQLKIERIRKLMIVERRTDTKITFLNMKKDTRDIRNLPQKRSNTLSNWRPRRRGQRDQDKNNI